MARIILFFLISLAPLFPALADKDESFKLTAAPGFFLASGTLVPDSGDHINAVRRTNGDITTLVMLNVPGSDDDNDYMDAAWKLHQDKFTTIVPSVGLIASGGTDFFLAGTNRIIEPGACIGVHSWEDVGPPAYSANSLPRDHEDHEDFLKYFAAIGIAADFYWFTINAASASDMHWMSPAEINRFGMSSVALPENDGETDTQREARCNRRAEAFQ
ncbi:MAG: alpha/beta hydrolase [Pseudomonadota bacterium]